MAALFLLKAALLGVHEYVSFNDLGKYRVSEHVLRDCHPEMGSII